MAWLAVDKDGEEWIYIHHPKRFEEMWGVHNSEEKCHPLPYGTVASLLDRSLKWQDEPVEI